MKKLPTAAKPKAFKHAAKKEVPSLGVALRFSGLESAIVEGSFPGLKRAARQKKATKINTLLTQMSLMSVRQSLIKSKRFNSSI